MIRSFVGFCVASVIICCWIAIHRELRKHRKRVGVQEASEANKRWLHYVQKKVAKMFFCITISLYACYTPLWIRAIAHGFKALNFPEYEIFAISLILTNSAINPIIYSFTSKIFRSELFHRNSRSK